MEFNSLANKRFSVRKFENKPVEEEKLIAVLEAARIAPSAVNYQPWHFIVIRDKEQLSRISAVYRGEWLKQAPVVIVACADQSQSWKRATDGKDFSNVDAAIAIDHLTLEAAEQGLGTCWVCNFNPDKCAEILNLPVYVEPLAIIPLGYPDAEAPVKKRKLLNEIAHADKFGAPFI